VRQTVYTQQMAKRPEVIWAFISDLRNDPVWRQEVKDSELISGEARGAPASYRETIAWEGLEATIVLSVSESVRGSRIVISGEDQSYSSTGVWTFEPQGDGTLVTLTFAMETKGAVHLVEPFMWSIVTRWLERDLPLLEAHI
jgi:hypothetical protein